MLLLGIETSCDETALALLNFDKSSQAIKVVGELIASQVDLFKDFGGVVPEISAREHLKVIDPLLARLLENTNTDISQIDSICFSAGPGLKGSLLMGAQFARGLALSLNIPLYPAHHIEGHLYSAFIGQSLDQLRAKMPFLALIVSGGHTELVRVRDIANYEVIARTIDDAAGEAFDKSGKLLGLDYPAGRELAELADSIDSSPFELPRVMRGSLGFSFSGLKTAISLLLQKHRDDLGSTKLRAQLCYSIQEAIVDALLDKVKLALDSDDLCRLALGGGVGANQSLRSKLARIVASDSLYLPKLCYTTDNATMVAYSTALRILSEQKTLPDQVSARWPLEEV